MKPIIYIVVTFYIFLFSISCNIADSSILSNELLVEDNDSNGSGATSIPNYYKNISEAVSDGVIGYWKMNENSGSDAYDMTGNQNGTASSTTILDGKYGSARQFHDDDDSNASKIELSSTISLTSAFTVVAWGKVSDYTNDPGLGGNQTDYNNGRLSFENTGNFFVFWTSTRHDISLSESFPTDEWFQITVVRDASNNVYVYKNSTNIGTVSSASGTIQWNRIGNNPNSSSWRAWEGSLDDFAIWNRALTPTEISNIYNSNAELVAD